MNLLDRIQADLQDIRANAARSTDGNAHALLVRVEQLLGQVPRAHGEVEAGPAEPVDVPPKQPTDEDPKQEASTGPAAPVIPPLV